MQVEMYSALAGLYDDFMKNIPYDDWTVFIKDKLSENGIEDGLICDLGCGSGIITTGLSDMGFDMIGIDSSYEMLNEAQDKKEGRDILYLCQDIRKFELYGTVKGIIATCDVLNYITKPEDLEEIFRLVNNYLDPGGMFIFDLHTEYYYKQILADNVFAMTTETGAYIWENRYDAESRLNEYNVTIFGKCGYSEGQSIDRGGDYVNQSANDLYERSEETHVERAYSAVNIIRMLEGAGLRFLSLSDGYSKEPLKENSVRAVF